MKPERTAPTVELNDEKKSRIGYYSKSRKTRAEQVKNTKRLKQ